MFYALCHDFISFTFEGDELYTIVGKCGNPCDSQGWTAVILERGSNFIVEQKCGEKDANLFKEVMEIVTNYVDHTDDLTFFSNGKSRYDKMMYVIM